MIDPINKSEFNSNKSQNPFMSMPKGMKKQQGKSFDEVLKEVYEKNKTSN